MARKRQPQLPSVTFIVDDDSSEPNGLLPGSRPSRNRGAVLVACGLAGALLIAASFDVGLHHARAPVHPAVTRTSSRSTPPPASG